MKNNKTIIIIIVVFLLTISLGIGYAYLEKGVLTNVNVGVGKNTWNLRYDNIVVKEGSVEALVTPSPGNIDYGLSFIVSLNNPGEFYEFTVDVVNDGTIEAKLNEIEITPNYGEIYSEYINYSITYENEIPLRYGQMIKRNTFVRLKVRIEYKTDFTGSQTTFENMNCSFVLNYKIDDGFGKKVKNNGVLKAITLSGDINEMGTIVTIDTENFYVYGTEGENVKLIAMYNLYVGSQFTRSTSALTSYGAKATGMQNPKMIGYKSVLTILDGVIEFSNDTYKGTNYSDYIGSLAEYHVKNYKNIMERKYGLEIEEARLIKDEELTDPNTFACPQRGMCQETYPWIFNTSFWTMSPSAPTYVWRLSTDKSYYPYQYSTKDGFGIRPVLIVKKSELL